jgi:hypothetical protein
MGQAGRDSGRKNDQKRKFYYFSCMFAAFSTQSWLFRADGQKKKDALLQNILLFDRIPCRKTSKKKEGADGLAATCTFFMCGEIRICFRFLRCLLFISHHAKADLNSFVWVIWFTLF